MTTLHAREALLPTGWARDVSVTIGADGRIASVAEDTELAGPVTDLLLPAPVNLHSHGFQRAMSGLTETRGTDARDSFWTWRQLMYRFLDRLTPEHVEAIAAQVFVETLEAGFGAIAEFHYLHHAPGGTAYEMRAEMAARIVAAATSTGIGLTLMPVFYAQGGCDGRAFQGGQLRFGTDAEGFAGLVGECAGLIRAAPEDYGLGVAPHSLRAVPPGDLAMTAALVPNGPVHIHAAEQVAEVEEVEAHLGARPVAWLLDNAGVDGRWCLIHCTQMTDAETRALAGSDAVAGLCPITEANLGDGIFNATGFVGAGGRFGVGSDSNVHIALFEELAALEYSQRLRDRARATLATPEHSTGRVLFENAALGGAQAAGRRTGEIRVGALADLAGLSTDNAWVLGRSGDAALDTLIFGGHGRDCIRDVWSAGRHVVQDGRHVARAPVARAFRAAMNDLGASI